MKQKFKKKKKSVIGLPFQKNLLSARLKVSAELAGSRVL